jgi:hypothetical protein
MLFGRDHRWSHSRHRGLVSTSLTFCTNLNHSAIPFLLFFSLAFFATLCTFFAARPSNLHFSAIV